MSKKELEELIDKIRGTSPTDKLKAEVDSIIKSDTEKAKIKAKETKETEEKFEIIADKLKGKMESIIKADIEKKAKIKAKSVPKLRPGDIEFEI